MMILSALLFLQAVPQLETFQAPGYETPVYGVWYAPEEAKSAMPMGARWVGALWNSPPVASSGRIRVSNFSLWRDEEYIKEMYPAVQRALRYAMTLDKNQDGLTDEDPGNE